MSQPLQLFLPAALGLLLALSLWIFLARALAARGASRWRAAIVGLPLALAAAGYGLFWLGFFSSPATAVQLHAIRLTLQHELAPHWLWIGAVWTALTAWAVRPLLRFAA